MEKNQQINCRVSSCKYHSESGEKCTLQAITVEPINNKKTMQADESMCASYKYEE